MEQIIPFQFLMKKRLKLRGFFLRVGGLTGATVAQRAGFLDYHPEFHRKLLGGKHFCLVVLCVC